MQQPIWRRISATRRGAALASVTALALAVTTSASTGRLMEDAPSAAGPVSAPAAPRSGRA